MRRWTALFYIMIGLNFAACSSRPVTSDMPDAGQASSAQTADTATDAERAEEAASTVSTHSDQEAEVKRYADAVPVVYMTEEITGESLYHLYEAQGKKVNGDRIAVWISSEELLAGSSLEPEFIRKLIKNVSGTIVTCSTESDPFLIADKKKKSAIDQDFTEIADQVIMDENGSVKIPVEDGIHLEENYVGAHFPEYDGLFVISHFKGHGMAGFDGAVKNISIGISSAEGKCLIYSAGSSSTEFKAGEQDAFLESMAEAGKSVADVLNRNILYMNVIDHTSMNCNCEENLNGPDMHDIGIVASADPVALDQACVDLIYMADGNEEFVKQIEELNGEYALEYAEEIGLGSSAYTLVSIDE